jgi:N-acetyl-anhydromuramyl-L-alanine amidase AmpD
VTDFLPPLLWKPSPNFSARNARVDLLVLHDCEGGYAPSVDWFLKKESVVSAHYVVREDGLEVTQMVELANKAWHCCDFNSRSVGVEMAGYSKNLYSPGLMQTTARMFAYLAHHLQIPIRHARGGVGPGIESHFGLGAAGGGHSDPSKDPAFMDKFVVHVQLETNKGDFPALWEPQKDAAPCSLSQTSLSTVAGIQGALKSLGYEVAVDGVMGPATEGAIRAFQEQRKITVDGAVGKETKFALENALMGS